MKNTRPKKTAADKVTEKFKLQASAVQKLYESFLFSGFTTEQAFELTKLYVQNDYVSDTIGDTYFVN